jgi:hypothetical protein
MNEIKIVNCPVCTGKNNVSYITTNALMHELNNERYEFKKMRVVPKCFLIKPRQSDLNNYYTNNYLPLQRCCSLGNTSYLLQKSTKFNLKE